MFWRTNLSPSLLLRRYCLGFSIAASVDRKELSAYCNGQLCFTRFSMLFMAYASVFCSGLAFLLSTLLLLIYRFKNILPSDQELASRAPSLPRGAVRGCSYLKWRVEGHFFLSVGWSSRPLKIYAQSTQLVERITMVLFLFQKDSISRFFLFFCRKNFVVDEKSTFHHHYHFSSDHTSTSFIDIHMGFHFL